MPKSARQPPPTFELQQLSNMGVFRNRQQQEYEPLQGHDAERDDESTQEQSEDGVGAAPFKWAEYAIFLLLGIAMLWAW